MRLSLLQRSIFILATVLLSLSAHSAFASTFYPRHDTLSSSISPIGEQKTLVLLVNYQDSVNTPAPTAAVMEQRVFRGLIQQYFQEQSYGKMWLSGQALGWYTIPRTVGSQGDPEPSVQEISSVISTNHINVSTYSRLVVVINHPIYRSGVTQVGVKQLNLGGTTYNMTLSYVGGVALFDPNKWTNFDGIFTHEYGHMLGLDHAHTLECGVNKSIGSDTCASFEYGNQYDVMGREGSHPVLSGHYNVAAKETLGWLDASSIATVSSLGDMKGIALKPLESSSGIRAIKVQPLGMSKPAYYIEYRQPIGFDSELGSAELRSNLGGIFILKTLRTDNSGYPESYLLDMTPTQTDSTIYSSTDWNNVSLRAGSSFTDPTTGVVISVPTAGAASGVSVDVSLKSVPCAAGTPFVVRYVPTKQLVSATMKTYIQFSLINSDAVGCGATNFQITPTLPRDIQLVQSNFRSSFTLAPQEGTQVAIPLFFSSQLTQKTYTVPVHIQRSSTDTVIGTTTFETDPTFFNSRFKIGDSVTTSMPTQVWTSPENAGKSAFIAEAGTLPQNAARTIKGGPVLDAQGFISWKINYQDGYDAWIRENNLSLVSTQPRSNTPTTVPSLELLEPLAGANLHYRSPVVIRWNSTGVPKVTLSIATPDTTIRYLSCVSNTGRYDWNPEGFPVDQPMRVKIENCVGQYDPTFTKDWTNVPFSFSAISGTVRSYAGGYAIDGVAVSLNSASGTSTTYTDINGHYAFDAVNGPYTITLSRPLYEYDKRAWTGNNMYTQFSTLQSVVNEGKTESRAQRLACDVNGDDRLDISDLISFTTGVRPNAIFPAVTRKGKSWDFLPMSSSTTNVRNFAAVLFGDCAGLWRPLQ